MIKPQHSWRMNKYNNGISGVNRMSYPINSNGYAIRREMVYLNKYQLNGGKDSEPDLDRIISDMETDFGDLDE